MTANPFTASGGAPKKHKIENWDMGRMLRFIEQESEQKANEIRIKAKEEHSIEIAELAIQNVKKIGLQKKEEIAQIEIEKTVAEGEIRSAAALLLTAEKEKILNNIISRVTDICAGVPLSRRVFEKSVRAYRKILPNDQIVIYVLEEEIPTVTEYLEQSGCRNYTILKMDRAVLGGIVIRNESRTVLINNSYLERIRKAAEMAMPALSALIFK